MFVSTGLAWNAGTCAWDLPIRVIHETVAEANAWRNINREWVKDIRQAAAPKSGPLETVLGQAFGYRAGVTPAL